jgi:hypothetical protein
MPRSSLQISTLRYDVVQDSPSLTVPRVPATVKVADFKLTAADGDACGSTGSRAIPGSPPVATEAP